MTNTSGVATATLVLDQGAGSPGIDASFAGNAIYKAASDTDPFEVLLETIYVKYNGDTFKWVNMDEAPDTGDELTALNLKGILREDDGHPGSLIGLEIIFKLNSLSGGFSFEYEGTVVNSNGALQLTTPVEIPTGLYEIIVEIKDNPYYTSAVDIRTISVPDYGNRTSRVEGSGAIVGSESDFGFFVVYGKTKSATPTGSFFMSFEVDEGGVLYEYIIKNNSWAKSGLFFLSSNEAYFESKSTIKKINKATGVNVYTSGNSTFAVQVVDGDLESYVGDLIAIRVFDGKAVIFEIGTLKSTKPPTAFSGLAIEDGGNILVLP